MIIIMVIIMMMIIIIMMLDCNNMIKTENDLTWQNCKIVLRKKYRIVLTSRRRKWLKWLSLVSS